MRRRQRTIWNCDYPPEWDEPDDEEIEEEQEDDCDPREEEYDCDRLTDLEIRYNRDY